MTLQQNIELYGWDYLCQLTPDARERVQDSPVWGMVKDHCAGLYATSEHRMLESGESATLPFDFIKKKGFASLVYADIMALVQWGYTDIKYLSGVVIPKVKGEGMRAWHVDWWNWDDPVTRRAVPPVVGILHYLDSTLEAQSGALMVIEGSNLRDVGCGDHLGSFNHTPQETIVRCNVGDIIVIDARTMHAVEENFKTDLRTCITTWYCLGWDDFSEESKAACWLSMDPSFKEPLGDFYPEYFGTVPPAVHKKVPKWEQ